MAGRQESKGPLFLHLALFTRTRIRRSPALGMEMALLIVTATVRGQVTASRVQYFLQMRR